MWTDEKLAELDAPKYEYGGKQLNEYEAQQMQRKNEREIRRWKREYVAMEAAGLDTSEAAAKLKAARAKQADFLNKTGLKSQGAREQISGFGRGPAAKKNSIANSSKSAMIQKKIGKAEVVAVHAVGKIDIEKYRCVSEDIVTDEVIITDERIRHIWERHPNVYRNCMAYLTQIVETPDYIIQDNKKNTAVVLKHIPESDERFYAVLRLATAADRSEYKNSILTFLKIREKEWNRLLRNKKFFTIGNEHAIMSIG